MKKSSFQISVVAILAVCLGSNCGLLQNAMGEFTIPSGKRGHTDGTLIRDSGSDGAILLDATSFASETLIRVAEPGSQLWVNSANFPAGKTVEIQGNGWSESAGLLGAIRTNGNITFGSDVRLIGDARLTTYSDTTIYSGAFSTAGDANYQLEKTGGGTLAIRPASGNHASFNGTWLISQGYVDLLQTGASTVGTDLSFGKNTVILNGGGIQSITDDSTRVYSNIEVRSGGGTINTERNIYLYGGLTGTGTLTKTGAHSLLMYGDNSQFEGTFINSNSNVYVDDLRAGSAKAAWVLNGNDFCIRSVGGAGTNTFYMGSLSGASNNFKINTGSNITFEIGALNTDTTFTGRLTQGGGGTVALTKVGTGTLTFNNNTHNYTGGTTIKEGAMRLIDTAALGTGNVTVEEAGALKLFRSEATSVDSKYSIQGALDVQKGNVTFDSDQAGMKALSVASVAAVSTNGKDVRVSSEYNQAGNLYKINGGSMALAGSDLANGATLTLHGGTLSMTAAMTSLPVTTGLSARFDAADLAAGTITAWNDTSGNGKHANKLITTGNAVGEITAVENALNGNSVVRFPADGNSGLGFDRITDIRTVFWVAKDDGDHNQSFLLGDSYGADFKSGSFNFHRGDNGQIWYEHGNTANVRNGTTYLNGDVVANPLVTTLDTNWNLIAVQTAGNVAASALCTDRAIANRSWDGAMAEVLIYNSVLTDAQMLEVTQYLNQKWGLGLDYAPLSDPTATAFSAPTTSVVLAADAAMNVANFESVTLGGLNVAGKRLTLSANATGTKFTTDIDLGSGGIIDMQGGELNQTGDLTGSGQILGDYSLDGDIHLTIDDPLAFSAIFVDGDFTLDNDAKIFLDILDPASIAADILLMDISGAITGLSESSFVASSGDFFYRFGDTGGVYLSNSSGNDVPEPATWLLLALGGMMLAYYSRRSHARRKARA